MGFQSSGLENEVRSFEEDAEPPSSIPLVNIDALLKEIPPAVQAPVIRAVLHSKRLFFPISPRSEAFRKRFYPESTPDQWNDWHWQVKNRITDLKTLGSMIGLAVENITGAYSEESLPLSNTVFCSLLDEFGVAQPLRKTVVPLDQGILSTGEK